MNKNGHIVIDNDGIWKYHDWEGNSVSYPGGYPDFKSAGMIRQEVSIGTFESYSKDFARADELATNGPKALKNTWHHHQDGTTMQELDRELHRRFTHKGGMSSSKNERSN